MSLFGKKNTFITRSLDELSKQYGPALKAAVRPWRDPYPDSARTPLVMAKLHNEQDLRQFVTGCDADIGGYSSVNLGLDAESKGRFWGTLDMTVPPRQEGKDKVVRSGYAGMRTKVQHTILGRRTWDTTDYRFLKIRLRNHIFTKSCFFVNISTDEWDPPKLWQHRLWLHPTYNWQEVILPFTDFTLTVQGNLAKYPQQPVRDDISTVGLSVLGPHGGPFDMSIDSIEAVNVLAHDFHRAPVDDRLLLAAEQPLTASKGIEAGREVV